MCCGAASWGSQRWGSGAVEQSVVSGWSISSDKSKVAGSSESCSTLATASTRLICNARCVISTHLQDRPIDARSCRSLTQEVCCSALLKRLLHTHPQHPIAQISARSLRIVLLQWNQCVAAVLPPTRSRRRPHRAAVATIIAVGDGVNLLIPSCSMIHDGTMRYAMKSSLQSGGGAE